MPPKHHLKLTNTRHLRRLIATTINKLLRNEIDPQVANSIGSLASVMLKTLKVANLEERLDNLEKSLEIEEKTPNPVTSDIRNMISKIKNKTGNKELLS